MKLEVGMYVRTKDKIVKIEKISDGVMWDTQGHVHFGDFIKASHNIIDLIEEGDLMYIDISPDNYGGIVVPRVAETLNELDKWKERFASGECILKKVLTKEQIVNNWYEVGE